MNTTLPQLTQVAVGYDGRVVLEGIDLAIAPGRWLALVGPNASGKTTLLKTLAGRLAPVLGQLQLPQPLPSLALPPDELPPFLTVQQCLSIHAEAHGLAAVPRETTELTALLKLDAHADTLVRHASLGTRQKLSVVLALMQKPRLLLLDEAFNGLDFASTRQLRSYLREQVVSAGMSIIQATHALDVVLQCCDELVLVESGRMAGRWDVEGFRGADGLALLEQTLAAAHPPHSGGLFTIR